MQSCWLQGKTPLASKEVLPSINELSFALDISRATAEKAYKHLKSLGLISSVPSKGFYDALAAELGNDAFIDFYIYNNDFYSFKKIRFAERLNRRKAYPLWTKW